MKGDQARLAAQVQHYLDTHLIEELHITAELLDVTAADDEDRVYLPAGKTKLVVTFACKARP